MAKSRRVPALPTPRPRLLAASPTGPRPGPGRGSPRHRPRGIRPRFLGGRPHTGPSGLQPPHTLGAGASASSASAAPHHLPPARVSPGEPQAQAASSGNPGRARTRGAVLLRLGPGALRVNWGPCGQQVPFLVPPDETDPRSTAGAWGEKGPTRKGPDRLGRGAVKTPDAHGCMRVTGLQAGSPPSPRGLSAPEERPDPGRGRPRGVGGREAAHASRPTTHTRPSPAPARQGLRRARRPGGKGLPWTERHRPLPLHRPPAGGYVRPRQQRARDDSLTQEARHRRPETNQGGGIFLRNHRALQLAREAL